MAKGKNKLNKTNSSGWLDDYSEELSINQYANGGIIDNIKEFFTEKTNKATPKSAPEKSSPKTFKIEDKRKVLATSGNPIRPNVDLTSGEYDLDVLNGIIESAKRNKLSIEDAKNLAAIAFQETKFGKVDENLGHVFDNVESRSDLEALTNAYITKMKEADRLGIKDDATRLQVYNGLGVIKPSTEQGYHGFKMKKIYGVPVPNEGINMKKNPLYGKQIMDLRDNVLNQNPEYVNYLNAAYNSKDPVPVYSDIELKTWGPRPLLGKFQSGGKINAPIYVDNPNDPRLRSYQDSTNAYINSIKTKNKIEKDKYFNFSRDYDVLLEGKGVKLPKDAFNKQKNNFKVYNKGTNKNMSPTDIIQFSGETKKGFAPKEGNFGRMTKNSGVQPSMITLVKNVPIYKKPTQPIIYKKTPPPQNTDFTTPNKEESLVLENYIQSIIEKNIPTQEISVKQDFAQYIQPKGYSRQGTAQERQSESFYDANGKMTGQIIEGQYVPTEYGKFLQSGITEDEYVNQIQEYAKGGKVKDNKGYLISNLDNFTPKKIINSNYITTNNMAFPVEANGVVLYPNTGDYVFPTDKVTEIPIMQNGSSINNDMRKKVKKYPAGGYLDYQEGFKGFGVGPQLYQDNSYFRSIMPDTIENMEEEINKPSVFSGINNVLGGIDQIGSQAFGLINQFIKPKMGGNNLMAKSENPEDLFMENYKNALVKKSNPNEELDMTGIEDFDMPNLFSGYFNPSKSSLTQSTMGPSMDSSTWKGVPFMKRGGYLRKYQNGGEMDMLPVGSPEYIHKSNVFHENYNPVPRVHFTDDTTPFDMGVNLNDLVNMNGGRINKYQNGGDMSLQGYFNYLTSQNQNRVPSRAFNANTNRASLGALEAANANDFLNTKMRNDRQAFEDDKVDWGFMDWAKEPTGALLGTLSSVPVLGDTVKDVLGDSFLTRTGGYQVGQGIGKTALGVTKIATGITNPSNILSGIGDIGEGVGSTVGNLNAKSAMGNYDKSGYVSGKRLARAAEDFNDTMGLSSKLYGMGKSAVDLAKGKPGALASFSANQTPYSKSNRKNQDLNFLFGQFLPNLSGMGGQGSGGVDFSQLAGLIGQDGGYLNYYQEGGMVSMQEDFEIPKFKKGGLTPKKAREILHDKSVHGNPLTDKQRKYFGYISSQKKSSGGWLDEL